MTTTVLAHRGAPGTAIVRREAVSAPTSRSDARRMKRAISQEVRGDARQKRKKVTADIKKLLAKRKRIKTAAREIVRDRHLDIDKAYRTGGHGWNWTAFRKSLHWKKGRGRPLGSRTQVPALSAPEETTPQYRVIGQPEEPKGYLPSPAPDEHEPGTTVTIVRPTGPQYRALPPGAARETRPERMLPVGPSSNPGTAVIVAAPRYRALPPGPTKPDVNTIKRVGPGSTPPRPQIGPHVRALLPAAGQTSRLTKMQLLKKKLSNT